MRKAWNRQVPSCDDQIPLINQGGATSGNILLKSLQNGGGVALTDHSNNIEIDIALSADARNCSRCLRSTPRGFLIAN
jgi:hypothetical protein